MRTGWFLVLATLLIGCQPAPATGATYAQRETAVLKAQAFAGTVLVQRGGKLLLNAALGSSDRAKGIPNRVTTPFRIGSVTKQFTAAAILRLADGGRLTLGDFVCRYLTACPASWQPVTLLELLDHTSGLADYIAPLTLDQFEAPTSPAEILALVEDQAPAFLPGAWYSYSNTNYLLLGMIVERASGKPYGDYLQEAFFGPLGMSSTGYRRDFQNLSGAAVGYGFRDPGLRDRAPPAEAAFADGGVYSTVGDLARWDAALRGNTLLPHAVFDRLYFPWGGGPPPHDAHVAYGLGWKVTSDTLGDRVVEHGGSIPGYSAYFLRWIDRGVTVIVLSNYYFTPADDIAHQLARAALALP